MLKQISCFFLHVMMAIPELQVYLLISPYIQNHLVNRLRMAPKVDVQFS